MSCIDRSACINAPPLINPPVMLLKVLVPPKFIPPLIKGSSSSNPIDFWLKVGLSNIEVDLSLPKSLWYGYDGELAGLIGLPLSKFDNKFFNPIC